MTVTPEQIGGIGFSTVKRGGYRTEEVDRFLRTVSEEYRGLQERVKAAEGSNEDLQSANAEMATLMRDVHAQLGERRRAAELEVAQTLQHAEREAAGILAGASEQAESIRLQGDRVLRDAEHHAALLRSDGEQRVREQASETLRAARAELQDLLRKKHEVLHALSALRGQLADLESTIEASSLSPDALDDSVVTQTLIDLRQAEEDARVPSLTSQPVVAPQHEATSAHPSAEKAPATFFSPPEPEGN
jgi:DivIVA domain-containing protein